MCKFKTYQVGGSVRDELMGRNPTDYDFLIVTDEDFETTQNYLVESGYKILVSIPERKTIRVDVGDKRVTDFTLSDNLFESLKNRDFTINSIAKDVKTGEIFDPFGGQYDILSKNLKFPMDDVNSFNSDPIRIFRALRFHITMDFNIDNSVWFAIQMFPANQFQNIRLEKMTDELTKMFSHDSLKTIKILHKLSKSNKLLGKFIFDKIKLRVNLKK